MLKKKVLPGRERTAIVAVAAVISIILYLAGVFSGLYANKIFEERTKQDINLLKEETKKDLWFLRSETEEDLELLQNYINLLDLNIKIMQLEQVFIETLDHEQMCNFSSITMGGMLEQLSFYWNKLPFRIEEYERNNPLSEEYLLLKQQYTQLSIRTWILARNKYNKCKTSFVPVLYFYSNKCQECVAQGEELDNLKGLVQADKKQLVVFTIDLNSDDLIVTYLKDYYGINSAPSIIINDKVFQGRLFSTDELIDELK